MIIELPKKPQKSGYFLGFKEFSIFLILFNVLLEINVGLKSLFLLISHYVLYLQVNWFVLGILKHWEQLFLLKTIDHHQNESIGSEHRFRLDFLIFCPNLY